MKGRPIIIETKLKRGDQEKLESICALRNIPSIQAKRARALLLLAEGEGPKRVASVCGVSVDIVKSARSRYQESGLEVALEGKKQLGPSSPYTESQRQKIIAIACSEAPAGRSTWSCELIAEEAVRRKVVPAIGRETVRIILQSHELKPWREKNVERS
jgi:putative transposase